MVSADLGFGGVKGFLDGLLYLERLVGGLSFGRGGFEFLGVGRVVVGLALTLASLLTGGTLKRMWRHDFDDYMCRVPASQ